MERRDCWISHLRIYVLGNVAYGHAAGPAQTRVLQELARPGASCLKALPSQRISLVTITPCIRHCHIGSLQLDIMPCQWRWVLFINSITATRLQDVISATIIRIVCPSWPPTRWTTSVRHTSNVTRVSPSSSSAHSANLRKGSVASTTIYTAYGGLLDGLSAAHVWRCPRLLRSPGCGDWWVQTKMR